MRFLLVLFLVCVQAMLPAGEKKGKLCVFIAGQAESSAMQQSIQADAEKLRKAFRTVAKKTKMKLSMKVAQGTECSTEKFFDWLKSVRRGQDTVVFYYSGKGEKEAHAKWPGLYMYKEGRPKCISGEEFPKAICKYTSPRFCLVVFDCYTQCLGSFGEGGLTHKGGGAPKCTKAGLDRLFSKSGGMIITSSGSNPEDNFFFAGEKSSGGVFTSNLLKEIYEKTSSKKANWVDVMDATKRLCRKTHQSQIVEYHATFVKK
jgi:hypothetical protein